MTKPFEKKTYYAMTLDPVHIGTGGYRLGRVDNTITREPGTNLPKVPGSSIAGVTRAYTAMAVQSRDGKEKYQRIRRDKADNLIIKKDKAGNQLKDSSGQPLYEYYSCAGKGADDGDSHCGEPNCEVCVPFGFSRKSGTSFQGLAQFFDARILFFPVYSMIGPVWITSCSVLQNFQETVNGQTDIIFECEPDLIIPEGYEMLTWQAYPDKNLNLGWLYLKNHKKIKPVKNHNLKLDEVITDRLVVVSDKLFSRIINDNLEVRTSVAIDPATGAAEEGALYTYEAIPRATVMWFDVVYNKPEYFRIRQNGIDQPIQHGKAEGEGWRWIQENIERGLSLMEYMGVGGMNTRGMGRLRILNLESTTPATANTSGIGGVR